MNQAQEFFAICMETLLISLAFFAVIGAIVYMEVKHHEK